jgi:hypothetical protein
VTWYTSEALQVPVDATPGTTLRLAATLSRPTPAEASGLARRGEQVIEPPTGTILAQVVRREREASAVCHVQVRLEDRVALVTQRFDLEVAFAPLEELRLVVPSVLAETPIELTAGDVGAVAIKTDRRTGDWVIPVEPSRTGRLTWTARFALELPGASDLDAFTTLPVPLIACATAEVQSVQLSLQDAAGAPVAAVGGDWRRQLAPAGDPVWIHEGAVEVISVSLPEAATRRSLDLIPRAWLRTIVGTDGSIRMRAQYRVAAGVRELPFRLPATWRPTAAWWGRQTVSTRFPAGADAAEGDWLIVAPAGIDSAVALVTVEIEAPVVEITALGIELRLTAPQLPADRLPAETVWQVIVPEDQHLVIRPEVFAPAYRWQRSGFVWKRQSQFSDAELQAWVGATAGPAPFNPHAEGKSYLFRTSRGAATIELRFVKELPLLFAGAGGTLLAGLLLLRVKRLRTLPVAVAAAALVAVASIGWTEAVLTLLQPILLGAGLLLFYKLIDSLASRGISAEPVARVTLPGQSSTVVPAPFVPPGSHDYTAVRTTFPYVGSAAGAPEPGSRS